jgi:hypothetical protein
MQTHSEYHTTNPEHLVCITEWKFVLNFSVSSGGAISGSGVGDLQSVGACHPYNIVIAKKLSFRVNGQQAGDGFTIKVAATGLPQPSGSVDISGVVSSLSGAIAGATFTLDVPFTDTSHTVAKTKFTSQASDAANIYTTRSSLVVTPAP